MMGWYWYEGNDSPDGAIVLMGAFWVAQHIASSRVVSVSKPGLSCGLILIVLGFITAVPSSFALGQVGPRHVLMWMLYGSVLGILAGMIVANFGWRCLIRFAFPMLVVILALPIPGRFNVPIQTSLQGATTTTAYWALKLTGYEVIREGFVFRLPSGDLGVVEACSGIKAFKAYLAAAAFASWYFRLGLFRGALAVSLSIPVVILANGLRVFEMAVLQESFGREATQGWKHEVFGGIPILLGLGIVIGIVWILRSKRPLPDSIVAQDQSVQKVSVGAERILAGVLLLGFALCGLAIIQPSVARTAVPDGNPPLESIPLKIGTWEGEELPVDPDILKELSCNKAIFRRYRNSLGFETFVWAIYWSTAKGVKGYHHPDVCMPARGQEIVMKEQVDIVSKGGRTIPATYREFEKGRERNLVYYWTQEGKEFWTPEDEQAAFHMSFPFRWIARRSGPRPADVADDRLVVMMATRTWGSATSARPILTGITGELADELYRVCPWADPKVTSP